ncbi:hypothetical protein D9757_005377 [Collybiopsis confluens]|uniref:Uncharacterized protein n=1 Tax=Collybiopsis confluens TaxID=2823264 RepID=A0A8H5HL11_9AGAR|nr:hypothetical protein D9757_005377 [Collybiopsis confluens]
MPSSIDELSSQASYDDDDDEHEYYLAQKEWEESLHQLHQIFSIVLLPYLGKWLGRRWSYWVYTRYLRLGLGKGFVFGK